mmetsp:Transcript_31106/g.47519  ORF Transcript_31106/g.47519 Transcript_31106/m.47519 type:complete len:80 (-) Transcript_31106:116-355(-)
MKNSVASTASKNLEKMFFKRARNSNIGVEEMKKILPCSIEAIDHLDELYVEGVSKLSQELMHARNIPQNERRLIDKHFI